MKPNEADNQKEVKRKVDRFLTVLKPLGWEHSKYYCLLSILIPVLLLRVSK